MASWSNPLESLNSGWDTTNYSDNLHHLPYFPDTVDQESLAPLHSLEQIGYYMIAGYPETTNNLEYINNPSSCYSTGPHSDQAEIPISTTDYYSDIFHNQIDQFPQDFLGGKETNNGPNYINNLHLQASNNTFPPGPHSNQAEIPISMTDDYSYILHNQLLDQFPRHFLGGKETNNGPNYINNLHLLASSNAFLPGCQLINKFMAFDRHMNLVLGDGQEFWKLPLPRKENEDRED